MAILIAVIIFLGIVFYMFSTSSNSSVIDDDAELESIYLIDEDVFDPEIFDERKDGFI